jgi:hypothetical protein
MTDDFGTPILPAEEPPKKRNTTMIIVVVIALLLLCCCCVFIGLAWTFGDQIVDALYNSGLIY